jgi:uncharacterized cupin superfamily protein
MFTHTGSLGPAARGRRARRTRRTPRHRAEGLGRRLRELRNAAGLSLRTLAGRVGFTPGFISQVENEQASPSIASLERIAAALGATLGDLFEVSARRLPAITRASTRPSMTSGWSRARVEALGPVGGWHRFDAVMITLGGGGTSGKHPIVHQDDEFAIVFTGQVTLRLEDEVHELTKGDAVTIPAAAPHWWSNGGRRAAQILIVAARPRLWR